MYLNGVIKLVVLPKENEGKTTSRSSTLHEMKYEVDFAVSRFFLLFPFCTFVYFEGQVVFITFSQCQPHGKYISKCF